jgi:hypothetical protein
MVQNPRIAFRDPLLQACRITRDQLGQPRPWAGSFAVVYKGVDPRGKAWAIRAFTSESAERRERYQCVTRHLQGRELNCLVAFEYRDDAIRSAGDGRWYPLVLMDWVEGLTLFQWVRRRCLMQKTASLAGQHFVMSQPGSLLFGRGDDCQVRLLGDPKVSRHHCILEFRPPKIRIRDLASRNGTLVNNVRHRGPAIPDESDFVVAGQDHGVALRDGDRITLGGTTVVLRVSHHGP